MVAWTKELLGDADFRPSAGDVVGTLTLLSVGEPIRQSDGYAEKTWECACSCGRTEVRSQTRFAVTLRKGGVSRCRDCRRERQRERHREWHRTRPPEWEERRRLGVAGKFWIEFYKKHGTAWPDNSVLRLAKAVELGLEEEGHRPPELVPAAEPKAGEYEADEPWLPPSTTSGSEGEDYRSKPQRAFDLYPMSGPGDEEWKTCWACSSCGEQVERGFGCAGCLGFACVACVGAEKHACRDDDEKTLVEIGADFERVIVVGKKKTGVSRELIRQIEASALKKLRAKFESEESWKKAENVEKALAEATRRAELEKVATARLARSIAENAARARLKKIMEEQRPELSRPTVRRRKLRLPRLEDRFAVNPPGNPEPFTRFVTVFLGRPEFEKLRDFFAGAGFPITPSEVRNAGLARGVVAHAVPTEVGRRFDAWIAELVDASGPREI